MTKKIVIKFIVMLVLLLIVHLVFHSDIIGVSNPYDVNRCGVCYEYNNF